MFDPTAGSARELIDRVEAERLRQARALVLDGRLSRPFYFDGRFLVARDLTREQNYFLTRQADLGRASGFGVVAGLEVRPGTSARSLVITAGHGVTPLGELIMLPGSVTVDLTNLPEMQRLNAAFGLSRIPNDVPRSRTGIYIVGLRPVEYTANPIASYPTSLNGQRSVEDSDIIEAVAVSLIPYQDVGVNDEAQRRRAEIAWRIFVNQEARELPAGVLPLAMVALNNGLVDWIDMHLVRREVGAEQQDILGLGYAPRALREAHVRHFNEAMGEIVQAAAGNAARLRFAAADRFLSLPPVGALPAAVVAEDFTQIFFPPEINVDLSIVPEDELPALVEEALMLPPINLKLNGDDQESTSVLLLVPVARDQVHELSTQLGGALVRDLRPAAVGLVASRRPLEVLRGIRLPAVLVPPVIDEAAEADARWRTALSSANRLWFVRRRNLNISSAVVGLLAAVGPDGAPRIAMQEAEPLRIEEKRNVREDVPGTGENIPGTVGMPAALDQQLSRTGLRADFDRMIEGAAPEVQPLIYDLLQQPQVLDDALVLRAAIADLADLRSSASGADAAAVKRAAKRYSRRGLGSGLKLLAEAEPRLRSKQTAANLALSGQLPEIDRIGERLLEVQKRAQTGKIKPARPLPETVRELAGELADVLGTSQGRGKTSLGRASQRAAAAEFTKKADTLLKSLGTV